MLTVPIEACAEQPQSMAPDLTGVRCVIVDGIDIEAVDLQEYLIDAGAEAVIVPDPAAASTAIGSTTETVVMISAAVDGTAVERTIEDDRVRHLLLTRGRRRRGRVTTPNVVTLDGGALRRNMFLRAVAVASGRASPEVFHDANNALESELLAAPTIQAARTSGQLVLVAEDDEVNRKVIRQQLALLGYAAEIVPDGSIALSKWRKGRYGLIITDLHMPGLDGYELAQRIRREQADGERVPIIALTANALRGEERRALEAGVDEYLTKPAPLNVLRATLHRWLPRGSESVVPESAARELTDAVLDIGVLKSMIGDNETLIEEFLRDYRIALSTLASELSAAASAGDNHGVGDIAHKLKSSSRAVGALRLGEVCDALEKVAKAGDTAVVLAEFARFVDVVTDTKDAIDRLLEGGAG